MKQKVESERTPYRIPRTYKEIVHSFTFDEMRQIAQIKRFMECLDGDAEFRKSLEDRPNDPALRDRLRSIGVKFDPGDLSILWSDNKKSKLFWKYITDTSFTLDQEPEFSQELEKAPLVKLWINWLRARRMLLKRHLANLPSVKKNQRFHAWRNRRIAASKSELGHFGNSIDHPLFAFELSKGCSIGCWFCAFSSKRLSGIFHSTPENRRLWRDVAKVGLDLFGASAGFALPYYGTEPHDNPNYLDFLKDYREITGSFLCTSTAAPLKDRSWLRSLITFYREETVPWPRLSVLNVEMLRGIHETYSPEELRDVDMLMQMRNTTRLKAVSGRTLHTCLERLGGLKIPGDAELIPQGSIACVSGFLVNMAVRTIRLVSPCKATDRWPYGYRVFAEENFNDIGDYRAALERMIDENMGENITKEMKVAFRDDLEHVSRPDGFTLVSPSQRHHIKGNTFLPLLGELIAVGDKTYGQIHDIFTSNGALPFSVAVAIKDLFDKGLLDEVDMG